MQTSFTNRVAFLDENYIMAWMAKKEQLLSMERLYAACCGKTIQGPSDVTWMFCSQPLRWGNIYSLPIFVFYLIKTTILLKHLLLDLSSWDKEPCIISFSLSHLTPWCRAHGLTPYLPNLKSLAMLCILL